MKKVYLVFLYLFIATINSNIYAQSPGLSIKLLDALSFTITQPELLNFVSKKGNKKKDMMIAKVADHITVVSSRGYEVRAISGSGMINGPYISLSPFFGETNKGNTSGVVMARDIALPPANGSPATVISAANSSWNGINPENKFNVEYSLESDFLQLKGKNRPVIPVIYTVLQP
jgi:hypothetical protein